jgi:MFS family permease
MVFDVTMGLSYPLLSLMLEDRGVSPLVIGLNASMLPLGLVVSAPFIPRLATRFGPWRFAVACIAATALLLALFKVWESLAAWFALRFLLGVVDGGLFAISEVWINQLASGRNRGRVIAVYASLLSLGFASGPFLLPTTGTEGWPPFLVGIAFALAGLVFMVCARRTLPAFQAERRSSFLAFLPRAPTLLLAAFLLGVFDTAVLSLFPLYGLGRGLDEATASYLLGVLIAGNIVLQFPLGWLADTLGRRRVLNACALLTALGALVLPFVMGTPWQWPLVLVWGTAGFGIYTLALADLGDRFTGSELLAGTAALTAMFGLGGIAGPSLGGAAMEQFGPEGLPALVAVAYGLLLVVSVIRGQR